MVRVKVEQEVKVSQNGHGKPINHKSQFLNKGPLGYDPKKQHWYVPRKNDRDIMGAINALSKSGYSQNKKFLEGLVYEFSEITGSHYNTRLTVTRIAEIHAERKKGKLEFEEWFGKVKQVLKNSYLKHPVGNNLGFQALKQILGDANRGWLNGQYTPPEKFAVQPGDYPKVEIFLTDPKEGKR
jgi:hypothetical protein